MFNRSIVGDEIDALGTPALYIKKKKTTLEYSPSPTHVPITRKETEDSVAHEQVNNTKLVKLVEDTIMPDYQNVLGATA